MVLKYIFPIAKKYINQYIFLGIDINIYLKCGDIKMETTEENTQEKEIEQPYEQTPETIQAQTPAPKKDKFAIWMSKTTREEFDKQQIEKGFKKKESFLKSLLGI